MNYFLFFFLFLFFVSSQSFAIEEINSPTDLPPIEKMKKEEKTSNKETILPQLRAIVLLGSSTLLEEKTFPEIQDISIDSHLQLPGKKNKLIGKLLPFLHRPLTQNSLEEIRKRIVFFYQKNNHPFVSVVIPPQEISEGVLQIVVVEGKVEKITTEGNRWTSGKKLKRSLHVKEGGEINTLLIKKDLAWLNRTPFHQSDLLFAPGERSGWTRLTLITKDRFPLLVYVGADNTGNELTGEPRLYTGFSWDQAFGLDQTLSYQFTTSDDFDSLLAHSANYLLRLPWRHELKLFGGYVWVESDLSDLPIHMHGFSAQISGRYIVPLPPTYGNLLHKLEMGYDYKKTNNALEFNEFIFSRNHPAINQFTLAYFLDHTLDSNKFFFGAEIFASPFKITHDQRNRYFAEINPFAKAHYVYGKVHLWTHLMLPKKFMILTRFEGQISNRALLPSEQYGLGGYDSVRGYREREINADNAFLINFEIHSPKLFVQKSGIFTLLSFIDYGYGQQHKTVPGLKKRYNLAGVGPGLRFQLHQYISLRADLGFQLIKSVEENDRHICRFHGGGTFSY